MKLNYKIIINVMGLLLILNGVFMLACIPVSVAYNEDDITAFLLSSLITLITGFFFWWSSRQNDSVVKKRDGYLIVAGGWLSMSLFGALPLLLSGATGGSYTDAFFETISGYTTTGSTIFADIEALPRGILLWRSITQWIGGMGIIVLTVAILPILGIGGMELYVKESPGPSPGKLHPNIKETAKRLWILYVSLTVAEAVLLAIGGMDIYDAVNHALTTAATGGFSTKNASIAYYDSPFIHYVIIIFMILAGMNYSLIYFGFKGNFKKVLNNEEFKYYIITIVVLTLIVVPFLYFVLPSGAEKVFRDGLFQVVSIITTTGYATADYTTWTQFLTFLFLVMMFIGGSAGSTAGGIKIMRHVILFKNSFLELKRLLHPAAIIPVRFNKKSLSNEVTFNILAFFLLYLMIFLIGSLVMSFLGVDYNTAMGAVATTLGNVGPGIGKVGPVDNFSQIPALGKWVLSFFMLLGRLELFTILVLLTPYFWRSN